MNYRDLFARAIVSFVLVHLSDHLSLRTRAHCEEAKTLLMKINLLRVTINGKGCSLLNLLFV